MENNREEIRIVVDTNIIMDVLYERHPFFEDSKKILDLCLKNQIHGYVAVHTIPTIWYLLRKTTTNIECRNILKDILSYLDIASISKRHVLDAIKREDFSDFEDCLQDECATNVQADYIVTRNKKDFNLSKVPVYLPSELVQVIAG